MKHAPNLTPLICLVLVVACGKNESESKMQNAPMSIPISAINYDALYVVNGGSNSISVLDIEKNEVSATIILENISYPHHVNMSPDKTSIVVAAPGMDLSQGHGSMGGGSHGGHLMGSNSEPAVMVLDAVTGSMKASRYLASMNHNGVFSPDGKEIWTTAMASPGKTLVLDSTTLVTNTEIAVGNMPAEITLTKDGAYAFVANGSSNNVSIIDTATKNPKKTVPVDEGPVGAWPGNDNVMYVDNEEAMTISAIDAQTLNVIRTYDLGFMPGMAATAPNGDLWVSNASDGKVVIFGASLTTAKAQITTGAGAHAITFSTDGTKAFVSNQDAGTVSVIDVASQATESTVSVGEKPNGLLFRAKQ